MSKKKVSIELHYDGRCNYIMMSWGKEDFHYLEITEEELTGMERSLGIEAIDDDAKVKDNIRGEYIERR